MADFTSFCKGLEQLEISLKKEQLEQFYCYYKRLVEKNKVMNLTAITEYEEVVHKHFLDSLSLVLWKGFQREGRVMDIGTGAGFPGIPLKIAFPDLEMVLLDSLNKRVKFLDEVIAELGLEKITAVHGRAEDFARKAEYREGFSLCVSRAVAQLATLSEYCMPFVSVGGRFVAYKAGGVKEEIAQAERAVALLSGKVEEQVAFHLPGTEAERVLVVVRKEQTGDEKYPRKAGIAAQKPLGADIH